MSAWERPGKSNDWYTPKYVFDALGCDFDMDVANSAIGGAHVPCYERIGVDSLSRQWRGFIWMNPPYGGRNGVIPWLKKFVVHGDGIALVPDRTSAPWFQEFAVQMTAILFVNGKIKFERPDGSVGKQPGNGTALLGIGPRAVEAIRNAHRRGLGFMARIEIEELKAKI